MAWMNDKAAELGMEHTHFENPNGLNDEGHYSTAADMAALARVVMEHEALAKIVGTVPLRWQGAPSPITTSCSGGMRLHWPQDRLHGQGGADAGFLCGAGWAAPDRRHAE